MLPSTNCKGSWGYLSAFTRQRWDGKAHESLRLAVGGSPAAGGWLGHCHALRPRSCWGGVPLLRNPCKWLAPSLGTVRPGAEVWHKGGVTNPLYLVYYVLIAPGLFPPGVLSLVQFAATPPPLPKISQRSRHSESKPETS